VRARVIGSLIVTTVGIVFSLMGGPFFAGLFIALGVAGYREYLHLADRMCPGTGDASVSAVGYGVIPAFGITALFDAGETVLLALCMVGIGAPLLIMARGSKTNESVCSWSLASFGTFYLAFPIFAAISLRSLANGSDANWLSDVAVWFGAGWPVSSFGLAWTLTVILAIWTGDTIAFLVGRSRGKRRLAPNLSPNKTIEGALGGLLGAMFAGALCFLSFGLGESWQGVVIGGVIGIVGQIGDLAESFLKRQAGAKDSGSLIPGHGGLLDRLDSLLFAFPIGFLFAKYSQLFSP